MADDFIQRQRAASFAANNITRDLGVDPEVRKPDGGAVQAVAAFGKNAGIINPDTFDNKPPTNFLNSNAAIRTTFTRPNLPTVTVGEKKEVAAFNADAKKKDTRNPRRPKIILNPLEDYASYNVLWTLAALTKEQFNNPALYRRDESSLKNVIFSSAGRYGAEYKDLYTGKAKTQRVNTAFGAPEYYINNFNMNCIIGNTDKTGNSNAIKFSFDIYEPYSMGILLQSMQNAAIKSGFANYLDNAPYVLKMEFVGFDELGNIIKSVKARYFTMKILTVKFQVNESGSTYKVEAIPYNHQAFADLTNTSYTDIKITGDPKGKGDVVELLSTGQNSLMAVLNRNEKKVKAEGLIGEVDEYVIQFPEQANIMYSSAGSPPVVNQATVNPNQDPNQNRVASQTNASNSAEYPVNKIGLSSLGFDQKDGGTVMFKRANEIYDPKTGIKKIDNMAIDVKRRAFQFGQGHSIIAMINQIILSSEWAKETIKKTTPQGFIEWFKIDIQVELLKLDDIVGDYAKRIIYRVVPYYIHQSIFATVNQAPLGYAELEKLIVKEYSYIYTGQNVDVLKFDININNLFYAAANPAPLNEAGKASNPNQQGTTANPQNKQEREPGKAPATQLANVGRARPKRTPTELKLIAGGSNYKDTEQAIAEAFQRTFVSGASVDMVSVDLEILGDPYFIVDNGVANYFAGVPDPLSQVTNDGTMNYESGTVYVYLTFRTPADVNEVTGLYDFSMAAKESPFGGIYRVNLVENIFQDGIWRQKLKLLRMPGPQGPEIALSGGTKDLPQDKSQPIGIKTTTPVPEQPTPTDDPNKTTPPRADIQIA